MCHKQRCNFLRIVLTDITENVMFFGQLKSLITFVPIVQKYGSLH